MVLLKQVVVIKELTMLTIVMMNNNLIKDLINKGLENAIEQVYEEKVSVEVIISMIKQNDYCETDDVEN